MKKFLVSIFTIIAIGTFTVTLLGAMYYSPSDEIPLPKNLQASAIKNTDASKYPTHLTIPKIKVDAKVQQVGITRKGNMATPNNFVDVGWYKYGVLPGEDGSAVIAGHVDNGLALPGVFINLNKLETGDDIYITIANKKLHFVVTGTTVYDFSASTGTIFKDTSGKLIKLITCTGDWIPELRTHDKRLVVTAELLE